jgi:hypothetical protein
MLCDALRRANVSPRGDAACFLDLHEGIRAEFASYRK